jgi:hypothetical protein
MEQGGAVTMLRFRFNFLLVLRNVWLDTRLMIFFCLYALWRLTKHDGNGVHRRPAQLIWLLFLYGVELLVYTPPYAVFVAVAASWFASKDNVVPVRLPLPGRRFAYKGRDVALFLWGQKGDVQVSLPTMSIVFSLHLHQYMPTVSYNIQVIVRLALFLMVNFSILGLTISNFVVSQINLRKQTE